MESQLLRLVIAAFIGFVLTVHAVLGENRDFSPDTGTYWVEAPVPATYPVPEPSPATYPATEQSPVTSPAPVPESKPPGAAPASTLLILPPPESVPPPYRLPRRMSPPPWKPMEFPPPLFPPMEFPPPPGGTLNDGKRVGLLFAGMAAMLQVFVAAYIIYKRRQLF